MALFDKLRGNAHIRTPRAERRLPMNERVEIKLPRDGSVHVVFLTDLSIRGACISTPLQLGKNHRIEMTLGTSAKENESVRLGCRVASIRRRQTQLHIDYGLQFVAIKPSDVEKLRAFIEQQESKRKSGVNTVSPDSAPSP